MNKYKHLQNLQWDITPKSREIWNKYNVKASTKENVIDIFGEIGEDFWGDGITANLIKWKLKQNENKDVEVHINSGGGNAFEGIAIYNLLKEHKGKVTVKVMGLAGSAASIIAMAGDEIQVAKSAFLMIHNTWLMAGGNKEYFREVADEMEQFDTALAGIYEDRTGLDKNKIVNMMIRETFISGADCVDMGFADKLLQEDTKLLDEDVHNSIFAKRRIENAMAKAGLTRKERIELLKDFESDIKNKEEDNYTKIEEIPELKI